MSCVLLLAPLLLAAAEDGSRILLRDDSAAAREALAAGDAERALTLVDARRAPGLAARALEALGRKDEACGLYEADAAAHEERKDAAILRHARCATTGGAAATAKAAWASVLSSEVLADEPFVLLEAGVGLTSLGEAKLAASLVATRADRLSLAGLDTERREALAQALLIVVEHGGAVDAKRALQRLYVDLPDTAASKKALATPAGRALDEGASLELALSRAEALTARHDSEEVLRTLARHRAAKDDASPSQCHLRFLAGKAERKLRRYKAARGDLDFVGVRCEGELNKKALYLAARVAAIQGGRGALAMLQAFAARYPEDTLTDDVLLWKGDLEASLGMLDEADRTYAGLLEAFPTGDMAHDARFKRAFLRAKRGDSDGARALFDDAARAAAGSSVDASDRALYWRARLTSFPQLDELTLTADPAKRNEGLRALLELAAARPASYYGHVARLLVEDTVARAKLDTGLLSPLGAARTQPRAALSAKAAVSPSAQLLGNRRFQLARALVDAGYDDEATWILDGLSLPSRELDDRLAVAILYERAGRPGAAHGVLRDAGLALLPGSPKGENLLSWALAYPRAFEHAVVPAANAAKLPPTLLFGLAREESAFDASVVSWAGAVGLCQLMPPTAKDEAASLKLPPPTIAALRDPTLNARLGAAHLSRRMRGMSHPLLAIAAYNAGPGGVARWTGAPGRMRPLDAFVETIPVEETRGYVKKVTGSWVAYSILDGGIEQVRFPLEIP